MTEGGGRVVDLARVRRADRWRDELGARLARSRPDLVGDAPADVGEWVETLQEADVERMALSLAEAAETVGLSVMTLRRAITSGELPAMALPRAYRISKLELERWWRARGGGALFPELEAAKRCHICGGPAVAERCGPSGPGNWEPAWLPVCRTHDHDGGGA